MFSGKWRNELGSEIEIHALASDGTFVGNYTTAVGDDDVVGKREPLIGRASGELISFIVDFQGTGSMTSWMGRYVKTINEEKITSLWILGRTVQGEDDEPVETWASFLTNGNTFIKSSS